MNRTIKSAWLCLLCVFLVACQSATPEIPPVVPTGTLPPSDSGDSNAYPVITSVLPEPYPLYPGEGSDPGIYNPYPLPGDTVIIPPSGYEPQPADQNLQSGEVFLDLENSEVILMESYPLQVSLLLRGDLPTPCHQLRVLVQPADVENRILVEVYSVVDPETMCTQVIEPFEARVPLGSFAGARYSVFVNGELLGEFDS